MRELNRTGEIGKPSTPETVVTPQEPPGQVRLHHVGFVLASIEERAESIARSLGAKWDGNIILDPLQKARVSFLTGAYSQDTLIELVEPHGPESPVSRFLNHGGGLHHLCYEVANLDRHLAFCRSLNAVLIQAPVPAVAFQGRRIAWAFTKHKMLLEFLERQNV
jgi:methylmalonyl-CoA/ethylmalonyl-CoA epimerase